jgi:hypothetical protein
MQGENADVGKCRVKRRSRTSQSPIPRAIHNAPIGVEASGPLEMGSQMSNWIFSLTSTRVSRSTPRRTSHVLDRACFHRVI